MKKCTGPANEFLLQTDRRANGQTKRQTYKSPNKINFIVPSYLRYAGHPLCMDNMDRRTATRSKQLLM